MNHKNTPGDVLKVLSCVLTSKCSCPYWPEHMNKDTDDVVFYGISLSMTNMGIVVVFSFIVSQHTYAPKKHTRWCLDDVFTCSDVDMFMSLNLYIRTRA